VDEVSDVVIAVVALFVVAVDPTLEEVERLSVVVPNSLTSDAVKLLDEVEPEDERFSVDSLNVLY
jgi:hypothetical protein